MKIGLSLKPKKSRSVTLVNYEKGSTMKYLLKTLIAVSAVSLILFNPTLSFAGPLHDAAMKGDVARVKSLIRRGANVNATTSEDRRTPLYLAISRRKKNVARILVVNGADVNAVTKNNQTALHEAARNGMADMTRLLLANWADPNIQDEQGNTPLVLAVVLGEPGKGREKKNYVTAARYLIKAGADLEIKDSIGNSPLHWAASLGFDEMIELFVANSADIRASNRDFGPLDMAIRNPRYIRKAGADPRNPEYEIIHKISTIKLLIKLGASVNERNDKSGYTPLFTAISEGSNQVVRLLISKGAEVNFKTRTGSTPLHHVTFHTYKDEAAAIAHTLIESGADVNAKTSDGRTPLDYVKEEGELKNILRKAGGISGSGLTVNKIEKKKKKKDIIRPKPKAIPSEGNTHDLGEL